MLYEALSPDCSHSVLLDNKGTFHGYDINFKAGISQSSIQERIGFLLLSLHGISQKVAGDTEPIGEMSEFGNMDLAFLPVNQPYTMTVSQCVKAAELIHPKTLIPYHCSDTDLSGLSESLKGIEVIIPQFTCFPPCSETSQRR